MSDRVPMIKTWLRAFLDNHQAAFPRVRWPDAGTELEGRLWNEWLRAFIGAKVTEDEARAASVELGRSAVEIAWCREHPATIVAIVKAMRLDAAKPKPAPAKFVPPEPAEPIVLPEGVADYRAYWRHLVAKLCEGSSEGGVVQVRDGRAVR